jgi:hypothetical protein
MPMVSTMFIRRRKGVSTILGTLIFIGILFTSVSPMMLVMKQADNIYTQRVHEMEIRDEERSSQELDVFAYPVEDEDQIRLFVENVGVVPATVKRVWINDEYHTIDEVVETLEATSLGPFNVSTFEGAEFDIFLTTTVAKSYTSASGTIYYESGAWLNPQLGICVHIAVGFWGAGYFKIQITNSTWQSEWWESGFTWLGDIVETFDVNTPGTYTVNVKQKGWFGGWKTIDGSPQVTCVSYPDGPPVVTVTFGS